MTRQVWWTWVLMLVAFNLFTVGLGLWTHDWLVIGWGALIGSLTFWMQWKWQP